MSQRNPMNDRYQREDRTGVTRKSAASAKPKNKAAASVTYGAPKKKNDKERKAELKAARKAEAARQKELDRKYYKPDTERYQKLRRIWWASLGGAVVCTAASWLLRGIEPSWIAFACLIAAYLLIIFAFYIDFSKIRKERKDYQIRMVALEAEEARKQKAEMRKQQSNQHKSKNKKGAKANAVKAQEGVTE